jgi:glycosyltransferase involved in cell wall biosynthesis
VRVVHNGIAFAPFEQARSGKIRREYGVSDQTFLVALVGRIHYWKGQEQLLRAASILKEHGLADFRILMVGDVFPGYEHLLDRLKNEVAALSLESHVVFCGFRDDVPDVLRDADVVVIPSTLPDPFPTVALEAMIAAKPVIASATGGLVEMIEDGVTGYLVPQAIPNNWPRSSACSPTTYRRASQWANRAAGG